MLSCLALHIPVISRTTTNQRVRTHAGPCPKASPRSPSSFESYKADVKDEETEAQADQVTCHRSHGWCAAHLGLTEATWLQLTTV